MGSETRKGENGHYQAAANSGLESLAAEASRRVEKLRNVEHSEQDASNAQDDEPRSPSRSSGQRGKVRKAYTITKQRERWTEEEHDRFLQALKRYGRAWRKIEEHIGTKTAVQIRSHAQKFFSKLQREQSMNGGRDESSKNDINIPPPRPKRKPMHPYPRNSVENSDGRGSEVNRNEGRDGQDAPQGKAADAYANKSSDNTNSTRSTHVPNNAQYSTSSGYQTSQPMTNHHSLFNGQATPFSGTMLASQPSHVQLPPFPSLDTSSGENMTKVLKDAAMAAASAWNQVIAGASQKIQFQIQAQSMQPPTLQTSQSMWNMPFCSMGSEPVDQNPFMRQILSQLGTQQSAPTSLLSNMTGPGMSVRAFQPSFSKSPVQSARDHSTAFARPQTQRSKGLQDLAEKDEHNSDRDSRGSEEPDHHASRKSAFKHSSQSGMSYWSGKRPYSAVEAELGRSAWEMMNRVTSQKSRDIPMEEARPTGHMQAPSAGGTSGSTRRLMKPIPHSAKISPLQEHKSQADLRSEPCSNTSQLAHFFQRAAAEHRRDSQSLGNGTSGNGENGSLGDDENRFAAQSHKSKLDKGSNNGSGSGDGSGKVIKDNASNDSNDAALKDSQNTSAANGNKDSTDDLASANKKLVKSNLPGSDKASNNGSGSGSDEDANANGSDHTATNEEKGSREGSNSGQASPRDQSPTKELRSTEQSRKDPSKRAQLPFAHSSQHPHSIEAVWANSASLQNQQQALQDTQQPSRPTQAELVQQILPFKLTPQQQQAISTWAAANSQAQPHQYELMQSLLNGMAGKNTNCTSARASSVMDRQISSLTSADTGSNTECHTANALAGRSSAREFQKPSELPSRPSGFQPYLKRPAESHLVGPPAKRLAGAPLTPDHGEARSHDLPMARDLELGKLNHRQFTATPFGTQAVQRRAHS